MDFEDGLFDEPAPLAGVQKETAQPEQPMFFDEELHLDLDAAMPERMNKIKLAAQANNANDLYRHAHNLKGVAANFSAGPVSKLAAQIEALGKSEDITEIDILVVQLELETEHLRQYCLTEFGVE